MSTSRTLAEHYQQSLRDRQVLERISTCYPGGATAYQLAPLDQLHIGGLAASTRLLEKLDAATHPRVLDIGAGLGGLARLGAARGFAMTAFDITHRFSVLNAALGALAEHTPSYRVVTGDARRLPFQGHTFDAVIFQHSLMNMPELAPVLEQTQRVLRPGGRLVLHELTRDNEAVALEYPVPWASGPAHSHLLSREALLERLTACGFKDVRVESQGDEARAWRARQREKEQTRPAPPLSPRWVFGERFEVMGENLLKNLANRAIDVVEISACC
ncbi:methyltransferase domain-containing protein [Halomonas sp. HNIBRBA4712]|uniref:class I SAM-dependent methyltransferase n=1 Tax=Halomonas sp. HNIBRBA4712 TaxID=3373087 RepID=UPI003746A3AB